MVLIALTGLKVTVTCTIPAACCSREDSTNTEYEFVSLSISLLFIVSKNAMTAFSMADLALPRFFLKPENKEKLIAVLTYHVVPGRVMAADVVKLSKAKTVQGSEAQIRVTDGKVYVDEAQVTATDIKAGNGIIHVIDSVILPN